MEKVVKDSIDAMSEWMTSQELEDYKKVMLAMQDCSNRPVNLK